MLFNSHIFIFVFLPIVLLGHYLVAKVNLIKLSQLWLLAASLVFYAWWDWLYLFLLILSLVFNFVIALAIRGDARYSKLFMIFGVLSNVLLLCVFKYYNFVASNVSLLTGYDIYIKQLVLPLAISFYTFLQIAYLVDTWNRRADKYDFIEYSLFVTFFPHLIAGPIVHHYELIPQFRRISTFKFVPPMVSGGLLLFVIGLLKKLLLADPIGDLAAPVFAVADANPPAMTTAWLAAIAFGIGLYFDFSAYSDMAIGLARMFGVVFPYNFNSPYKATSIIDFWRRWHMTLSRFLRDYVYIPLGGSRHGPARRYVNLMATMLIGGIWHGAGWTFLLWGGLHGAFLLVNHAWRELVEARRAPRPPSRVNSVACWFLTMVAVFVAWVPFAAPNFAAAKSVLMGMAGMQGVVASGATEFVDLILQDGMINAVRSNFAALASSLVLPVAIAIVLLAPNSQQIVDAPPQDWTARKFGPWLRYRQGVVAGGVTGILFLIAVALLADVKEFVYFQF